MPNLTFGFPALDQQLEEEVLLIHHEPGLDPSPFLQQAAEQWKGDVVIATTQWGPERIRNLYGEHIWIVDAVSELLGRKSTHPKDVHVKDAGNIAAVIAKMDAVVRAQKNVLFIMDSLSGLAMRDHPERIQAHGGRLLQLLDRCASAICVHTDWHDGSDGIKTLFPQQLSLQGIRQKISTQHYFKLERPEDGRQGKPILYKESLRGLQAYVPKLAVVGPSGAGKTTFIHAVSQTARSAEYKGNTIGIDRGIVEQQGLRIELFGAPGQKRFKALAKPLMDSAAGTVVLVDASNPASFSSVEEMLLTIKASGKAWVIAANKQDQPKAANAKALAEALQVPVDSIHPCTMTDSESAATVLDALITEMMEAT